MVGLRIHERLAQILNSRRQPAVERSFASPEALGDDISQEKPLLDARLPDGSRVAAAFPPCSVGGTIHATRKFHGKRYTADELLRSGRHTPEVLERLRDAVEHHQNILIYDHADRKRPMVPSVRLGKALRFRPEDVQQFINEMTRRLA